MTARLTALLAAATLVGSTLLVGCSAADPQSTSDDGRISVVAAFYPLQFAAERIGGDAVDVTSLTPAGVEPHDLELTAKQVGQIAEADLVLYIRGFQPAIDEAVDQQAADHSLDVGSVVDRIAADPHIWLDPASMATIGEAVAARLTELAPDAAAELTRNAAGLSASMTALDHDYTQDLANCESRELVVSHEAFGYLAAAYGLSQVAISGLTPEAEPSPARLRAVADLVAHDGVTTIYYETLVDPKVAQTLADETGAATAVLDPVEGLVQGATGDYESIMRANLATLVHGQRCA